MRLQSIEDSRLELETGQQLLETDVRTASPKQLKLALRHTSLALNSRVRDSLWLELAARHASRADSQFDSQLETSKLPSWVDPRLGRFFALNAGARKEINCVLWHLSMSCPHMTFAPLVYPLVALFLHFHSPEDTYKALYSLVNAQDLHFVGTSRGDKSRDAIILVKLTSKFGVLRPRKFGLDAREKLRNNALDAAFGQYLEWIFCLPFQHCVRVVDCFLVEGEKFLFRVALSLALLFDKHRKVSLTLERMRAFCETVPVTPQQLIGCALKITRLSRKDIERAKTKADQKAVTLAESPVHSARDRISAKDCLLGQRIAPRRFRSAVVDNWACLDALWEWLPERVVVQQPVVAFCTQENGHSLQTFFALCADAEPTILLIRSIRDEVFGAFCSNSWATRLDLAQTRSQYFGTGETFLFTLLPVARKYEWVGRRAQHVSHSQQLFQSANNKSLTVGSGGGRFGLFVDESLTRGQSDTCDTFANDPLCSDSTDFDIAVLEVIAFC